MTTRRILLKPNDKIRPCPKCGQNTEFTIHSAQVAEDLCEVWAECKCGHEPDSGDRFEDVFGGVDDGNVQVALSCWNDAFASA
ncbi:hypothetical protein [Duganella vulcania]|uniref:Restriction alleviation protein, Lar family n=1 Tax=Duganella vulcania TaxID=2692166 RepID=A0A845GHW3_9BURK|nr:hypothetical protein [Duganella vulcania]MYM92638.1 hypothetical protein [Duganella vulcania]